MEDRQQQYHPSQARPVEKQSTTFSKSSLPTPTPSKALPLPPILQNPSVRPLSDIRELSEPSVIDTALIKPVPSSNEKRSASWADSVHARDYRALQGAARQDLSSRSRPSHTRAKSADNGSSSYSSSPEPSSFYNIPHSSIPRRTSSHGRAQRPLAKTPKTPSVRVVAPVPSKPKYEGIVVPNRGQSSSPVKETGLRLDPVQPDINRRVPSRTYVRPTPRIDILEFPTYRHPRIRLDLQVNAPLFVGGGSVEGQVKIAVDDGAHVRHRRSLGIGAISVDLLGYEEVMDGRRAIFLALGTELVDATHPPPSNMVEPMNPLDPSDTFWTLIPSSSSLPFLLSLPLDTGPPPFSSKHASIRFVLCVTALIRDAGRLYEIRTSQDVNVLATYDPEKALTSLPSPLTATDTLSLPRFGRCETLKMTAGVHRQVWVSGSSIFADVHISNRSHKVVRRLELGLERDLLCYRHTPASTREKSASQARIFESNDQTLLARSCMKPGTLGWNGIEPHHSETCTCELELPRGHATVRCGKHFEVRFFLNVTAAISNTKTVSVQLPIILIHINSLDVLPNSVAQVAAAIEEKRRRQRSRSRQQVRTLSKERSSSSPSVTVGQDRKPSYTQGRAFAAPRQQCTDRQRVREADLDDLQHALDSSPRKHHPQLPVVRKTRSNVNINATRTPKKSSSDNLLPLMTYHSPPLRSKGSRSLAARSGNARDAKLHHVPSFDLTYCKLRGHAAQLDQRGTEQEPSRTQNDRPSLTKSPMKPFTVVQTFHPSRTIAPHTLGLSTGAAKCMSKDASPWTTAPAAEPERPGTSLSLRSKGERKNVDGIGFLPNYEIPGLSVVRRKGTSGSLKDRGKAWVMERVRRVQGDGRGQGQQEEQEEEEEPGWI